MSRSRKRRRSEAGPVKRPSMAGDEPDHLDVVGERTGARLVLAVDAHDAAVPRPAPSRPPLGQAPVPISTPPSGVLRRAATAQPVRAHARKLGIGRAAQPLARTSAARRPRAGWSCRSRWRRQARPGAGPTLSDRLRIVAEVGELQPLDPDALARPLPAIAPGSAASARRAVAISLETLASPIKRASASGRRARPRRRRP